MTEIDFNQALFKVDTHVANDKGVVCKYVAGLDSKKEYSLRYFLSGKIQHEATVYLIATVTQPAYASKNGAISFESPLDGIQLVICSCGSNYVQREYHSSELVCAGCNKEYTSYVPISIEYGKRI